MYMEKGTACEQVVVGNNDKFQVTSHRPIPKANQCQPHPSRTCITKCNTRTASGQVGKRWKGLNQP